MSDSRSYRNIHRLRNQLNQILLEAAALHDDNEPDFDAATLRQLERIESLSLKLSQVESELKLSVDPEWLESVTRVLVVEDDATQRMTLANALRSQGFFVATASDGNEAIDYLMQAMTPDVILLDLMMPNCDGLSANRVIQHSSFGGDAKVIALTATEPAEIDCSSFHAFLQKPFRIPALLDLIHEVMENFGEDDDDGEDSGTFAAAGSHSSRL